ncbi:aldehyde dehydrogenase family protein [Anaerobacillus sp. MEB173]|uniref:aldehyde dehydrogenase family protein n=1 Tax=Anaerobacillus sp. MEB173 TaxID=3383345 RepID=UPI003F8DA2DE
MKKHGIEKKMFICGKWVERNKKIEVRNPENQSIIATVPAASVSDMINTIKSAKEGREIAANLATNERMAILYKVSELISDRFDEFTEVIALEGSKTIKEARREVRRCIETIRISAEETRRIHGETIPFDQMPGSKNRVGYYYRFPIGIIAAITPFNDPLNLVAHKVGPAIASGNAIIIKPATLTPLSALKLAEAFDDAGLPRKVLSVITGYGREIGDKLVQHNDVRMISFTGGLETGRDIAMKAGIKKLSMELGSNSPVIVLKDADLPLAVKASVEGAFSAAGQNCIGVQRIYIEDEVFDSFVHSYVKITRNLKSGSKLEEETDIGPMISEQEAKRIEQWVKEAINKGAICLCGGQRHGAYYKPTVLTDVPKDCKLASEEVFGPVVSLFKVSNLEEAIRESNHVNYGLQAGIFTKDIDKAFSAINKMNVGGIMINDSSDYRIDAMPFGGIKGSGLGREGIKFTIEEMTEPKVVCFALQNRVSE